MFVLLRVVTLCYVTPSMSASRSRYYIEERVEREEDVCERKIETHRDKQRQREGGRKERKERM